MGAGLTAARVGLLVSRREEIASRHEEGIGLARRLSYIKLSGSGRDVDEVVEPKDLKAAVRYADARVRQVLDNPDADQPARQKAMHILTRLTAIVGEVDKAETHLAGEMKLLQNREAAETIRAAAVARDEEARAARQQVEADRANLSADEFLVSHPDGQ